MSALSLASIFFWSELAKRSHNDPLIKFLLIKVL